MTIAEGWQDSERSQQCQYEAENGIRTLTGRQTDDGNYIFAENGDSYWSQTDEDSRHGTPSLVQPNY